MSRSFVEPPEVAVIFDKPGNTWTSQERLVVRTWLYEKEPMRYILVIAKWHLGNGATPQDGQDAWGEFYLAHLDRVVASYDPAKGQRFWDYLLFCFKRFCHAAGEQIRKQRDRLVSVDHARDEGIIEFKFFDELVDKGTSPEEISAQRELYGILQKCIGQLSPNHRMVIVMYHLEEKSIQEIMELLGLAEGTVKGWLYRGRQQLKNLFEKETRYYEQANH